MRDFEDSRSISSAALASAACSFVLQFGRRARHQAGADGLGRSQEKLLEQLQGNVETEAGFFGERFVGFRRFHQQAKAAFGNLRAGVGGDAVLDRAVAAIQQNVGDRRIRSARDERSPASAAGSGFFAMPIRSSVVRRRDMVRTGPATWISLCLARRSVTSCGALSTGARLLLTCASVRASTFSMRWHENVVEHADLLFGEAIRIDQKEIGDAPAAYRRAARTSPLERAESNSSKSTTPCVLHGSISI